MAQNLRYDADKTVGVCRHSPVRLMFPSMHVQVQTETQQIVLQH